ncbi:hypothetical protein [Micromonospora avicenniae]
MRAAGVPVRLGGLLAGKNVDGGAPVPRPDADVAGALAAAARRSKRIP